MDSNLHAIPLSEFEQSPALVVALFNVLMHDDALGDFSIDAPATDVYTAQKLLDRCAALGIPSRYIRFT